MSAINPKPLAPPCLPPPCLGARKPPSSTVPLTHENYLALCTAMVESNIPLDQAVELHRELYVKAALSLVKGNQCHAARLIGCHRNTVNRIVGRK
jgi:hypothetical protein